MKKLYILSAGIAVPFIMDAQSAIDGFRFSQPDLKGTARYMGMGGAFGALGGDLSSISTNPAGIGVYRRNELGITLDLDCQTATSEAQGVKTTQNQTKFLLNNAGGVASWNLANSMMPNINFGFTYNRAASFNAHYTGVIPRLSNSLSNYISGISNTEGVTERDVQFVDNDEIYYEPYNPVDGGFAAPWLSILGYDSYLVTEADIPLYDANGNLVSDKSWVGQWGPTTSGTGAFDVQTTGGANEYNFTLGGNIANQVFWGVNFGIVDFNYGMTAVWGEKLENAIVNNPTGLENASANWKMTNFYNVSGTGYNVKVGLIYRPIQELRLGLSFASPTWYSMNESFLARVNYKYGGDVSGIVGDYVDTNGGQWGTNSYNFRTPWKLTGSAAGVIGRNLIVSADVEWQKFNKMRFYDGGGSFFNYGYDGSWDDFYPYYSPSGMQKASPSIIGMNDTWYNTNAEIEEYYKSTVSVRLGAEYRITPRFSARLGYAYVSSPVRKEAKNGDLLIFTSGTLPNYKMDNSTNYITCGLGYNFNNFYIDGAFVHKVQSSEYHAYTSDPLRPEIPSPTSKLTLSNNQIVLSAGVKF